MIELLIFPISILSQIYQYQMNYKVWFKRFRNKPMSITNLNLVSPLHTVFDSVQCNALQGNKHVAAS